jgi:hypothetical protein
MNLSFRFNERECFAEIDGNILRIVVEAPKLCGTPCSMSMTFAHSAAWAKRGGLPRWALATSFKT